MASRLDRLVALLDNGATPLVRATAARQIGGIQKQHPEELFRLLARVYEYVGSKSWDTRVAASQAVEAIIKEVSDWDPSSDDAHDGVAVKREEDSLVDADDMLTFSQFNVDSVLRHGRLLLGSAGREYDDDEAMAGLDPQQRIAAQRAQMRKRLGIGAQFLDEDLLDDVDLGADDLAEDTCGNKGKKVRGQKRKLDPSSPQPQPCKRETPSPTEEGNGAPEIDMSKLSARERNRLKRKARTGGKKKAIVDLGPKKNGNSAAQTPDAETPPGPLLSKSGAVDVTEQPGSDSIVVESKRADTREALFAISEGTWAFESLVEVLCIDLFDPSWEVRHGAGMALREIFKHHGHCAGRVAGASAAENNKRNQRFLEDVSVRLLCVFTLDRFGDFVSDHVVAPVRETCAQAMGVVSQFLTQPLLVAIQQALLQLIARGAGSSSSSSSISGDSTGDVAPIWEARHSGLSGLRYIVAVRRDMAPLLVMGTLDAALAGLCDHDDDVRSVSAEALLPLVDTMVTCQPTRILDVINGVWTALTDLGDDLTASVASVMELLARLFSHPQVRAAVIEAGRHAPERYAFAVLIPQLYPFFRHTIVSVRRATVQSLLTFASMREETRVGTGEDDTSNAVVPSPSLLQNTTNGHHTGETRGLPPSSSFSLAAAAAAAEGASWVDTACLRLVFQNMVLETNTEVLELSAKLWEALLRQCRSAADSGEGVHRVQQLLPSNVIGAMFRLASTPIGVPMPQQLLYDSRCNSTEATGTVGPLLSSKYNVDKPMIQQDRGLISRETIMRCRVQAAEALGLLAAVWPASSRAETLGSVLTGALRSGWSLQCQLAGVVIEEMVMAERTGLFAETDSVDTNHRSSNPMLNSVQLASSTFVDCLRDTVTDVLSGTGTLLPPALAQRGLAYYDLQRSLAHVHANCQVLYATFSNEAKVPDAAIPALPPLEPTAASGQTAASESTFTLATAERICNDDEAFDRLLGQASVRALTERVRSTVLERRQRVRASIAYYQQLQQQLDVSTNAALAGALVAIGKLPAKLNAVLRAIMAAVKLEPSELLQARAAQAVARLAALCYCSEDSPRKGPADKMVRNLATFVCSDPWTTPVFAQRAQQEEAILMLEMVQREQAMREVQQQQQQQQQNGNKGNGSVQNDSNALMAAAATASAQASQRKKRRGKAGTAVSAEETTSSASEQAALPGDSEIPLVQASALAADEHEKEQAARLIVRGAERAVEAIARLFGADVMRQVPKLWECVSAPLAAVYGPAENLASSGGGSTGRADVLAAADASFANIDSGSAQAVVDALRVLLALSPALDASLRPHLVAALPWVMSALASRFSAVRHMAARTVAELCHVVRTEAMQAFVQSVLPSLGDTTQTHRRQGAAEAIYYIVQRLGAGVLAYVPFLMVPVLGRMSDGNEQTRLVCTNCFAQLLKLVPLEADIPDPDGLTAERREHERKFLAQLMDPTKLEPFRIPVKINATLRKYQQEGVDWLAFLNKYELHGILCDDMGLGKTLQTICAVAADHFLRAQKFAASVAADGAAADSRPLPSLVVCPPTLISHWEQEMCRFAENLRPLCYAGTPAERRPLIASIAANAADVVIMSYDVVRNDIELLAAQHWNYCILDEGHCIKNGRTKLTQAVKRVRARRRLILSGTPVQNNVIELWSLFDFLMPGFLGSERQFNEMYSKPILASRDAKQMSHAQVAGDVALKALHKQVLPFLLRRMKEDVLQDLPPKIIQDYYCELSPLQRFLYTEFAKSAVTGNLRKSLGVAEEEQEEVKEEEGNANREQESGGNGGKKKQVTHVFQALQYLRKLCNHPALVLSPKHPLYAQVTSELSARGADLQSLDIAPKMQALRDLLHQCGIGVQQPVLADTGKASASDILDADAATDAVSASHRVLIFCQHKEMIARIEQDLFARHMRGVTYMRVDGTVEARRRQEIVTQFNTDPSIDCLLLTTHVGGLGLNLTGADTVIFVEHDYNPAMDLQAMDRAHRLGQTRVVNVYRLITRNTLEEKIMGLQAFKLHMANTIVNQQNSGLSSMNTDQLLDLFNVSPPPTAGGRNSSSAAAQQGASASGKPGSDAGASISKAIEGLEELWDASQYEDEYNLDTFISSLQQ
ncbi:TATA-binding protein-associated factor mot1 [Coemansia sp. RSA 2399]|nr:TATA-binding protein-associated factor mot1 [Coemansia sp. RSA 2399]